jgi:hypothetical protein
MTKNNRNLFTCDSASTHLGFKNTVCLINGCYRASITQLSKVQNNKHGDMHLNHKGFGGITQFLMEFQNSFGYILYILKRIKDFP